MYQSNLLNVGYAAPLSMGLTYIAMANSIAKLMGNAVSAEGNSQVIQNSNVTQCCALIIATGAAKLA
ncbi:RebB family R body protein [Arenicella xantha]|uniref:Killing trait domain-containing protein n=1 Tax=Arenicella xantha TaxID=644221 RepID=A0A395JRB7_9GAMM|nr:RebB family R body protein [Arenicella xantha]RBP53105.1 killing trait domain-containing protein [Arenicella xantha]